MAAGIEDVVGGGMWREAHEVVGALGSQHGLATVDPRPIEPVVGRDQRAAAVRRSTARPCTCVLRKSSDRETSLSA